MGSRRVVVRPLQLLFLVYLAIPLISLDNFKILSATLYWLYVLIPIIALAFGSVRKSIAINTRAWSRTKKP